MIKIYGSPWSSARRVYWTLEEASVAYERQPLNMQAKEHRAEAYLKINPNGKVPCIIDGDFVLWESMAINWYLAEKYKPTLLGKTPEEKGLVNQWSYWAILELQKPLVDILIQTMFVPEDKKDHALLSKAKQDILPFMRTLDQGLAHKKYLVANDFTLADLNAASVVHINSMVQNDISEFKNVSAWMQLLTERSAFKKVLSLPR